jgi:SOS-response transcriptional repressor LexA
MDVKDRLLELVAVLGVTRREFARAVGITEGNISDWCNKNKITKPSITALGKIKDVYNVNTNWFISGEGQMFLSDADGKLYTPNGEKQLEEMSGSKTVYQSKVDLFDTRTITLPMLGYISAGIPVEGIEDDSMQFIEIPKTFLTDITTQYCVLTVNGRLMEPSINNGDIVVIQRRNDWYNLSGKICAVRTRDGITLKKVQFDEVKKQIFLVPINNNFDIMAFSEEELEGVQIVGSMVMQFRVFK